MGNCLGAARARERKEASWRATGLVSLRDGGRRQLPPGVRAVAGTMRVLDAANNELSSDQLQAELQAMGGAPKLQRLVLSGNRLGPAPPPALWGLGQLRSLMLDANRLAGPLPDGVAQLERLEVLLLRNNQLEQLPAALGRLAALRQLDVSHNALAALPDSLGGCAALEQLDASSNRLRALPPAVGRCAKLKVLQADDNSIAEVPGQLLQGCSQLHTLSLHRNPVTAAELEATPGYAAYDARRRAKYDKGIAGGALIGGMDEGVDRQLLEPA